MASESAINGNFVPQNGYGSIESGYTAPSYNSSSVPAQSNNSAADIPKDEVGWYFVEQYYTTLSRSPEKIYLFYNKRSQFVSGNETEKVEVCVGQRSINERIKELDFSECKVRVTNVDSQASDDHIVIQVIGEISNKSAPHKKFTQTFVLAAQTNGYFVLNDIFRYIIEEEDEAEATEEPAAVEESAPAAAQEPEHETLTSSEDPVAIEKDAAKVDKEIEEKIIAEQPEEETAAPAAAVEESPKVESAEVAQTEETPAAAVSESTETAETAPEAATEAVPEAPAAQEEMESEKPKDPEPTPAPRSPVKQASQPAKAAAPAKPAAPSAPKTWANLAAAAHRVATPVVTPQPSASAAPAQAKAAPQSEAAAKPTPAAPAQEASAVPARESSPAAPSADQQEEWTSVGDKKQNKGQAAAGAQDAPQFRAYVKNVHESITLPTLREALEKYGELQYFDANRPKNCAFVDFKSVDGYKAALKASPISIGEHAITIEERRPKDNRPFFQGGRGGARGGRGGANQAPRGSFQGGRGGGSQRGRGGAPSRGRGGAQAA
ncbi:hypothetical protein E4T44_12551 [Aureobasidium sp. EXF-8845]|nr:hypothetical protein E4T44_12551 [Aureobasidium sp. EXF-8845]